jgi:hypothetical protein
VDEFLIAMGSKKRSLQVSPIMDWYIDGILSDNGHAFKSAMNDPDN